MKWIQPIGLLLVLYIISHPVNAGDQKQYFEAGKAFGKGRNAAVSQGVTTGKAQAVVPGYNTNPPETTNYGLSDLVSPRQAKISGCASASLDPKVRSDQECIAVNFTQRAPSQRPQIVIDPAANQMVTRAETVLSDPAAYAGQLDGTFSDCQTRTTTTPAQYTTETCTSMREIEVQQCTMGRVVNIDADANFQCDQTINAYAELSCKKKTGISVTSGITSTTGVVVLAPISDGVYLYTIGLTGVIYLHTSSGDATVHSGAVYSGTALGLDPRYQWVVTHNYCVLNACSGSVAPTTIMREIGPLNKYISFQQSLQTGQPCPGSFDITITNGQSCGNGFVATFNYSCANSNDVVVVSWSHTGVISGTGETSLGPGQTVVAGSYWWLPWTLRYNGNGSFTYQGYLTTSCSGEGGNIVRSYSAPSITKSVSWHEINECAGLEARAQ